MVSSWKLPERSNNDSSLEGGFEVPPAPSAPLVAAKLLVLTVIGMVVIRAKAAWGGGGGEGDGNGAT